MLIFFTQLNVAAIYTEMTITETTDNNDNNKLTKITIQKKYNWIFPLPYSLFH